MVATVNLPYYANQIPSPLPTNAEIEAAPDITLEYGARRIVEIGSHFVVKFGKGVDLIEGENMIFVRKNTRVNISRVYALYSDPDTGKNYIVMERIAGETLLSLWAQLSLSEKETVVMRLREYFDELRRIPPPGYYGSLGKRYLLDEIFWTKDPDPAINGPFISIKALHEAMALKYTHDGLPPYRADFCRQCFPRVLYDSKGPTFSHGDYQRKNIMVQRDDSSNLKVIILDWEKSGWYPSYWEYCLAVSALRWDDDWCLWLEKALDPYVPEAAWLQAIRPELWS